MVGGGNQVIVGFLSDTARPCPTGAEGAMFLQGFGSSPPENFEKSKQNGGIWRCLWHYFWSHVYAAAYLRTGSYATEWLRAAQATSHYLKQCCMVSLLTHKCVIRPQWVKLKLSFTCHCDGWSSESGDVSLYMLSSSNQFSWWPIFADCNNIPSNL